MFKLWTIPGVLRLIESPQDSQSGTNSTASDSQEGDINPASDTPPPSAEGEPLGEPGIKALKAEREARQKAETDLAEVRAALQNATATDSQALADAQARVDALEKSLWRSEAGRRFALPEDLLDRLQGSTLDEVLADAKTLADLVKPKPPQDLLRGIGGGEVSNLKGRDLLANQFQSKRS